MYNNTKVFAQSKNQIPKKADSSESLLFRMMGTQDDEKQEQYNEIEMYLHEQTLDKYSNPLVWWKDREGTYKVLSIAARKYLCVPASSAPSEIVFSLAGRIFTRDRNRLSPQRFEKILFLKHNLATLNKTNYDNDNDTDDEEES